MSPLALSELVNAPDTQLVKLHDELHDDLLASTRLFKSWYHEQLVVEMEAKGLSHYERDDLDELGELPDYELASGVAENHVHQTMLFEDGCGFTDVVGDHYHMISGGQFSITFVGVGIGATKSSATKSHDHSLKLPSGFGVKPENKKADVGLAFLEKMSKSWGSLSLSGGHVAKAQGHTHKVVILDPKAGDGQTSFDLEHNHWVFGWGVQEADDHVHDLDPESLTEMSGSFDVVETQVVEEQPKSVPEQVEGKEYKSFITLEFGEWSSAGHGTPKAVSPERRSKLSSLEAWELWGSEHQPLLITPVLHGLECQAHVQLVKGRVQVLVFADGRDVTDKMAGLAGTLRSINVEEGDYVILSGVLTSRSDRVNATSLMKHDVNEGTASMTGVFYVEDCWYDGVPMTRQTAEQRRKRANNLLAMTTTHGLKLLPSGVAYDETKALRVTEKSSTFEGAHAVRWRSAESTLEDGPEELLIY